jgi:maltose alpha-D-glucosyltransferase/alpha-amylase
MHRALASDSDNKDFAPESFTPFYQRSLYQSMRNLAVQTFGLLRTRMPALEGGVRADAQAVLGLEADILRRLREIHSIPLSSQRIRCHGDFHLGQVLYTGKDFIIIDFEGEPARPLGERRIKRSPIRDVAGMLRSFDYVTYTGLRRQFELGILQEDHIKQYEPWSVFWSGWISTFYLKAYFDTIGPTGLLPGAKDQLRILLNAHLLEKAIYEVAYELNNRPDWAYIPLRGILRILGRSPLDEHHPALEGKGASV